MNRLLILALAASLTLAACSKQDAAPGQTATAQGANAGKVLQVQQAGGYTYAQVDAGGKIVWIAGGPIQIKAGDTVQWGQYAIMRNFNAKSLGRTFDEILFVDAWGPAGGSASQVAPHGTFPNGQPAAAAAPAQPAGGANQGEVKTVANAGGYTYVEVAQGGGTVWIAAPETALKVGDKVSWDGGAVMQNFTAKSLNRTFDQIVFAGAVNVVK